tara:strand:+ start:904 stop:1236 length:333 start_codon:yes stop_codon:yes gene_type:complete
MAETFKYVQGDTGPQLRITLTDEDTGTATDLSSGTVKMHFRAAGSTTLLFTKTLTITSPPTNGIALVAWSSGELNQDPGTYHGEIEVTRGSGVVETLFDIIKFKIREDFA